MFIRVDTQVPVEDLIKGMIVQSGNDACIALAEAIAGSEDNFAQMMNREAQRLGMKSSSFRNSTGLPRSQQHFTTARDLSLLASALIRDFPAEGQVLLDEGISLQQHHATQPQSPPLAGPHGGRRQNRPYRGRRLLPDFFRQARLAPPALGGPRHRQRCHRASESLKLLNWGFQFYEAVRLYAKDQALSTPRVWKGTAATVKVGFPIAISFLPSPGLCQSDRGPFVSQQPMMAPVQQGQKVGTMKVTVDGKPYGEFPVPSPLETVPVAGIFGRMVDSGAPLVQLMSPRSPIRSISTGLSAPRRSRISPLTAASCSATVP